MPWPKLVKHSLESNQRRSLALRGIKRPPGYYKKTGDATRLKWKNPEFRAKFRLAREGEKDKRWKGDNVGKKRLHNWLRNKYGSASVCENKLCEIKSPKRFDWANVSRNYKRDRNDFVQLCRSCHLKFDRWYSRMPVRINDMKIEIRIESHE